MKQLTKPMALVMAIGAIAMALGIGLVILWDAASAAGAVIFAVGAVTFAAIQITQTYDGPSLAIKRLRRIMVMGDILFIVAALLLLENVFHLVFPFFAKTIDGYNAYVHYIHNNWVVALLIAAIFEMYTTHRISYELNKETKRS